MKISIINGPNMNLLGIREVEFYGNDSLDTIIENISEVGKEIGIETTHFQSNYEGEIVEYIQRLLDSTDGFIINPAGFSKTGYSILDALNAKRTPFVEVHLSNIFSRGKKHTGSIFSEDAIGVICGFKGYSYVIAILALYDFLKTDDLGGFK